MLVIGFGRKAQVGKNTATDYLEKKYPGKLKQVAFADKVKKVTMDLFGLSYEQCYGAKEIKEAVDFRYELTPREIMQGIGDKMRQIYPNIWIDTVFFSTIPELQKQGYEYFAISDVRYPNEADRIHELGGFVVDILREGAGTLVGAQHPSETSMDDYKDFDWVIENNGTFEEYYRKLDGIMEEIHSGRKKRQGFDRRQRAGALLCC